MNTRMQDAYKPGWKLAAVLQGAPDALLDTYESEPLPIARSVLASTTARVQSWGTSEANGATQIVQNMVKTSQGTDPFSDVTQFSVTYQGSRLCRNRDEVSAVRAGDHAPDAPCVSGNDDSRVRLFNLFQGTPFTLLAFSQAS